MTTPSNLNNTTENEELESIKSTKNDQLINENTSNELAALFDNKTDASAPNYNTIDIYNRFPKELAKNSHVILIVGKL